MVVDFPAPFGPSSQARSVPDTPEGSSTSMFWRTDRANPSSRDSVVLMSAV